MDKILISHNAGWFDPQKRALRIQAYTNLFEMVILLLHKKGFMKEEINMLLKCNPAKAFAIDIRKVK